MTTIKFSSLDARSIKFFNTVPKCLNVTPIWEKSLVIFEGDEEIMKIALSQYGNDYETFWKESAAYQQYLGNI